MGVAAAATAATHAPQQQAPSAAPAQQQATPVAPPQTTEGNLYVGGLPEGIDEAMFRILFGRYGSIVSVKLVSQKQCGYVKYASKQMAKSAIDALNGFECNGVKLTVKYAD